MAQSLRKLRHQRRSPAVSMGLEHAYHTAFGHFLGGPQAGGDLTGMVGVIVIHRGAAPGTLELKAPTHAGIGFHTTGELRTRHAQKDGNSRSSHGIIQIMLTGNAQLHAAVCLAVVFHIKVIQTVYQPDIDSTHVAIFAQTEIQHPFVHTCRHAATVGIVAIDHQHALLRHQIGKLPERTDHVIQIIKEVGMIHLHVQHHTNGGRKLQKGVLIFAAFCHKQVTVADAQGAANAGQFTAHHHGRIQSHLHGKGCDHRGGGGLAVGTCHTDRMGISAHDPTPRLCTADHRNAGRHRRRDLGILIGHGSGADHQTHILHRFRKMSHRYGDTGLAQMFGGCRFHTVRPLHLRAQMHQHFCQCAHGNTADAHQMNGLAAMQHLIEQFICHRSSLRFAFEIKGLHTVLL